MFSRRTSLIHSSKRSENPEYTGLLWPCVDLCTGPFSSFFPGLLSLITWHHNASIIHPSIHPSIYLCIQSILAQLRRLNPSLLALAAIRLSMCSMHPVPWIRRWAILPAIRLSMCSMHLCAMDPALSIQPSIQPVIHVFNAPLCAMGLVL